VTPAAWFSLSLLVLALLSVQGCSEEVASKGSGFGPKPAKVEVVEVVPEPLSLEVALTGQLEAEFDVVVKTEIDGVIESIEFQEGKPVKRGEVLFRLRDAEQRAHVKEASAERKLAKDVLDRTQRLTNQDISSVARRSEATAALDEADAKVDLAKLDLARTRVRAPFDGVAGSLMVGPGERVEPDNGLVEISAIDKLQLIYTIPEPSIFLAQIDSEINIRVVAFKGERFKGRVFFISPSIDRATRRLIAKAWIPNDDHRLKPGMFANVDIRVFDKEAALMVPEAAMVYDRNGTYVWRVDGESLAEKIPVEIGIRQDGRVEILKGLAAHDRVVSAGIHKVSAGKEVIPVPTALEPAHAGEEPESAVDEKAGVEG
jgi:membrane fusion protein (multidrug efflux system)